MKYSTKFPLAEDPISEGGLWISGGSAGIDWGDVLTTPGHAFGRDGALKFGDPTALLTGNWEPDQEVRAAVYSVNQAEKFYQEVELRLRSSLAERSCTGYEILFRCLKTSKAYMEIVRWNGPVADFTYLSRNKGPEFGVENGDVVKASITGNTIKVYINDKLIDKTRDDVYPAGNPGIGFNYGCGETYCDFGFTSFSAESTPSKGKDK
jgi:hypothetical protein